MNKLREFAKSSRKELFIELIFTLFGILIRDELLRVGVLVAGCLLITIMVSAKPKVDGKISYQLKLLLQWLVVAGSGYFVVPYLWMWGIGTGKDLMLLLIALTFGILWLPIIIFGKNHTGIFYDEKTFLSSGSIAWMAAALATWAIIYSNNNLNYVAIPLFLVAIGVIIYAPKGGLWLTTNIIAGGVYSYLWMVLLGSNLHSTLIAVLIASISSAMITGLSFVVIFER
jgi:hypothetical protein